MSDQQTGVSPDWRLDYLMLAALWGSSFLFMRMGATEFGALATAWTRVCVATLFLWPLMLWQGHWALFKSKWKIVLGFGVFNSALPFAFFAYAVMHISTGLSAILASEDVQKAFQPQGMDPANSTPEEFGKLVERDANRWAELIKIQNIKAE